MVQVHREPPTFFDRVIGFAGITKCLKVPIV